MEEVEDRQNINPIEWQAKEFQAPARGKNWYIVFFIVLVVTIAISLYYSQWLFAGVVLMVSVALLLSNRITPRTMRYRVDSSGVMINDHMLEYSVIKGFWFHKVGENTYLNIISTAKLAPVITSQLDPSIAESVKSILSKFLPELAENNEDWIDRINRFLKV